MVRAAHLVGRRGGCPWYSQLCPQLGFPYKVRNAVEGQGGEEEVIVGEKGADRLFLFILDRYPCKVEMINRIAHHVHA